LIGNKKPRKPIGKRNGINIFSRLKAKTKLASHKKLNLVSDKQKKRNQTWKEVTDQKAKEQNSICQWCGLLGKRDTSFDCLTGHHVKPRRYNDHTIKNCYVCHLLCHQFITDHNVDVLIFPNKATYDLAMRQL
jgi:hypothetical protein